MIRKRTIDRVAKHAEQVLVRSLGFGRADHGARPSRLHRGSSTSSRPAHSAIPKPIRGPTQPPERHSPGAWARHRSPRCDSRAPWLLSNTHPRSLRTPLSRPSRASVDGTTPRDARASAGRGTGAGDRRPARRSRGLPVLVSTERPNSRSPVLPSCRTSVVTQSRAAGGW